MPPREPLREAGDPGHDVRFAERDATGNVVDQCRTWLDWAAAQISDSLASDTAANHQLLASISKMMGPGKSGADRAQGAGAPAEDRNMSAVITAVQAHDRVMQGLAHVAQSLRELSAHLGDCGRIDSAEAWRELRERQFRVFSMHEERMLFARMVGGNVDGSSVRDSFEVVELFATEVVSGSP
jgi:hypothetical protein